MTARRDGSGVGDGSPSAESSGSHSEVPTESDGEAPETLPSDENPSTEPFDGGTPAPSTGDRSRYTLRTATMLALQAVLTAVVVSATVDAARLPGFVPDPLAGLSAGAVTPTVPPFVYTYATLGALGYTFTRVVNVGPTAERLTDWTIRVLAALPLAAGTYLFAALLLPESVTGEGSEASRRLLAGLAFLTGLFVDLAYRRLSQLARRLVGDTGGESGGASADGSGGSRPDEIGTSSFGGTHESTSDGSRDSGVDDTRDSTTGEADDSTTGEADDSTTGEADDSTTGEADDSTTGDADDRSGDADDRSGDADDRSGDADDRSGDADDSTTGDADDRSGDSTGSRPVDADS
ncbi:hypothetical protein RYH80_07420 [Halobaculum sp. MBLA0147]|uniref:hypothetical protein n=1 Tax=Halobaculum sp. MBLA0147 TaxID=3079934 RepID=UPI00352697BA